MSKVCSSIRPFNSQLLLIYHSPLHSITANNPQPMFNPFNAYYWSGQTMGMSRESLSTDIEAYCPGLDCAINCST
jgi:hypothetical protein